MMRVCFNTYSPSMVRAPPKSKNSTAYMNSFKYGDLYRLTQVPPHPPVPPHCQYQ
jgi:hypothetical protein